MRIGVDACCWSNRRGFGRFTRELLRALVAADKENEYLFFVDSETASGSEFPDSVRLIAAHTKVSPTEAASASGRRSLRDLWALSSQVMRHRLDLFFFPAVYSYFPVLNRAKIIVTIHDLIADNHPEAVFAEKRLKLFWKSKQLLAVRQSDLILTVSEFSRQQIVNYFKVPESHVKAISEGPGEAFVPLPQDDGMREALRHYNLGSKKFLLYVGGISPHKNLKALVQAFYLLTRDSRFGELKLVIVGDYKGDPFHSDYPALKLQIEQLGLGEKVIFTGFIKDQVLAYLYNAASVMVLPSIEEGFGLPIVEAMACGTPVISSERGSLPEILGDAGLFFDPYSPPAIVNALTTVLGDAELQIKMRQTGLARATQFTWNAVARKTALIFNELASEN